MHKNYTLNENILKTLIKRNIHPTDPYKKLKLIIYNYKFKTFNLVINNKSPPRLEFYKKKNPLIYQFKCLLEDCISENKNIYVVLTSTTLSRQLTMHLSDTSSKAQHLKNIPVQKLIFGKFLPKTQYKNNKTTNKNYRFSKHSTSKRNYLNLIEPILNPVLMYFDVFSYFCYFRIKFKNKRYNNTQV